ncbi:hypothetical protein ACFYN3_37850 [Streptomyces lavendulae]|uniref:hypothetical protein n=1 Tax=Streptomyces lavendulae TaxID=1914 RepID=UPI0036D0FBEB
MSAVSSASVSVKVASAVSTGCRPSSVRSGSDERRSDGSNRRLTHACFSRRSMPLPVAPIDSDDEFGGEVRHPGPGVVVQEAQELEL